MTAVSSTGIPFTSENQQLAEQNLGEDFDRKDGDKIAAMAKASVDAKFEAAMGWSDSEEDDDDSSF